MFFRRNVPTYEEEQKTFLLKPGCFGLRAVFGIFWPEDLKAKNKPGLSKNSFFVLPNDEICRALTLG